MSASQHPFWELLRTQLAPTPERIRLAVRTGLACTTSTAILISLQVPGFALGVLFPMLLLIPAASSSFRVVFSRLVILAVCLILAVPISGIMVDLPWVWLPTFFILIAVGLYLAPLTKRPVAFQASMTALVSVVLVAHLDPGAIGSTALWVGCSLAIGISVAGLYSIFFWPIDAEDQFSKRLAEGLRASHLRLRVAIERYAAESDPGPIDDPPPMFSMALNLQALNAVQQAEGDKAKECLRLNLIHIAQRLAIIVVEVERLVKERLPEDTRRALYPHLNELRDKLDEAVAAYTDRIERGFGHSDEGDVVTQEDWPDILPILRSLRVQIQEEAVGESAQTSVSESSPQTNLETFVEAMREIADLLHTPPDLLEREADERTRESSSHYRPPFMLGPLNKATLAMSLKGSLATTICLIITLWAGHLYLETSMWTTLLLSQSSYGAVVRKSALRMLGALVGGLLALATTLLLMTNATDLVSYLAVIFVITTLADYGGRSSPHIAYGFLQMGITYLICASVLGPTSDVFLALERFLGIAVGIGAVYLCFRYIAPDYAGNQMLQQLAELVRPLVRLVESDGQSPVTKDEIETVDQERLDQVQNLLRLADEAVFEGPGAGINQDSALAATGTGTRISLRLTSLAFARLRIADNSDSGPTHLERTRRELEDALRAWLACSLELIETTEGQGQPQSTRRRQGRQELIEITQRPLPDLEVAFTRFLEAYSQLDQETVSPATHEVLAAETTHFRRLVILAPKLRDEITATCVPKREELPSIMFGIRGNHQPA